MCFGKGDSQPELFALQNRDEIEFDNFSGFEKSAKKFKETLTNFKDSGNSFFDTIIYGLMY